MICVITQRPLYQLSITNKQLKNIYLSQLVTYIITMRKPTPNYRLSKSVVEQTSISCTYNIQNSQTSDVWRAKVFDLQQIHHYDMLNVLQYNQQVFYFLKDKYENSLYLQNCFEKNGTEYLVFEYWTQRLSDYISKHPNGLANQAQVQKILQDVLLSICDIYAEDFMITNLRSEHIVKVASPGSTQWKIESLVFDYQNHGLPQKCEYQFDYQWASNEEKVHRQNLEDKFKDQQIVWYMGMLALRLVNGAKFNVGKKFSDADINFTELKKICSPSVFELIKRSVRANLQDRIPLKSFLNLAVFNKFQISLQIKQKFISGNSQRIKKSQVIKNSILLKSSMRKSSMLFTSKLPQKSKVIQRKTKSLLKSQCITQTQASKLFQQLRWTLQKCLYLGEIKDYTQSAASIDEASVEDKTVIRYLYFKLAAINLERLKQDVNKSAMLKNFRQSLVSRDLYKQLSDWIESNGYGSEKKSILLESIEYEKKMKILDPKKLQILSPCQQIVVKMKKSIDINKISSEELVESFAIINGKFFSSLKKLIQKTESSKIQHRGIKIRALCYFILSSYVILVKPIESPTLLTWLIENDFKIYHKQFFNEQLLSGSVHVKFADDIEYVRLCEFTNRGKEQVLVQNAQVILNSYFKTVEAKSIEFDDIMIEKEQTNSVNLKVPSRVKY